MGSRSADGHVRAQKNSRASRGAEVQIAKGTTQRDYFHIHRKIVVVDLDYEQNDCFKHHVPVVVPARTLLSQLL